MINDNELDAADCCGFCDRGGLDAVGCGSIEDGGRGGAYSSDWSETRTRLLIILSSRDRVRLAELGPGDIGILQSPLSSLDRSLSVNGDDDAVIAAELHEQNET